MTRQNADNAGQANGVAAEASKAVDTGREAMRRLSTAMGKIKTSADETAKIIKTIDEIAFQTNLLALNAAVKPPVQAKLAKALRSKVRNLAQRSAEAAKDTSGLIADAQNNADSGVSVGGKSRRYSKKLSPPLVKSVSSSPKSPQHHRNKHKELTK